MIKIDTVYDPKQGHWLDNGRGKVALGGIDGTFLPYELLFGALSACFYSTLSTILRKRRIQPERVEIQVSGEKREEVPATLVWVKLTIDVYGEVDQEQVKKAADLAARYCSIHETLSRVAEMQHEIIFHDESN